MATSVSYVCPSCTAPLSFTPGSENIKCEYCGGEFTIKEVEDFFAAKEEKAVEERLEQEKKWESEQKDWSEEEKAALRSFVCSSCGAEIVSDENTMATECCYCGNPTMLPARFDGMLKPDYVIPFQKTKDEAVAALKKFYEGKYLLPDNFTSNNRVENIQPMYVPFWLFDADTAGDAVFRGEKIKRWENSSEIVTETSIFSCRRHGTMAFKKVPADGSKKMNDDYMDSIEPFDYGELVPFTPAYLAGFLADKYDVTAEECTPRIDRRLKETVMEELRKSVTGYDGVYLEQGEARKTGGEIRYAMAPVWILTTRYNDKPYTFMMNGQTGKVVGSLPYDMTKSLAYPTAATLFLLPIIYFAVKILLEG